MYNKPSENTTDCWFPNESDVEDALNGIRPYIPDSPYPYAYFHRTQKLNDNTIEGYLGRTDYPEDFHNEVRSNFGYFIAYNEKKKVYITFDKLTFYYVDEIFPTKPLLFTLKKVVQPDSNSNGLAIPNAPIPLEIIMTKNFEIEKRETYDKQYLKGFLKPDADFQSVAAYLKSLSSVKNANVTKQQSGKIDMTIYPARAFSIEEVEKEVSSALESYLKGIIENVKPVVNNAHFLNIQNQILDVLDAAKVSIWVAMAWFTNEELFQKLIEKQQEGIDIKVAIFNDGINQKHGVDIKQLSHKMIRGSRGGIMHNKFCVVDNQIVITGSYNWSINAETKNDENVVINKDPELATKYSVEFRKLTAD